ncbi:MAG: ABC transporter ATP-binding protein [Chitinivibrionales bacterium]|nr:ABC transporter ATP-binding protein [Chitinivibrionales bacterium]
MQNKELLIVVTSVMKQYHCAAGCFSALNDISFSVARGELIAVTGESGSGKSTLLNLLCGIDSPTAGSVTINGTHVSHLTQEQRNRWRGGNVGIVFQFFQLIPTLTIRENILLPMDFCAIIEKKRRAQRADHLLDRFSLSDHAGKYPFELSGGQQQRVAVARSLANDPPFIVADEPTGNLDSRNAESVFALLATLKQEGKTVIMVTHNHALAQRCDRIICLHDGSMCAAADTDRRMA